MQSLNGMKITWLGHATFHIVTARGTSILIDPWVMGNPRCPKDRQSFEKIDLMLCSHGHFDHTGDAVELAKRYDPTVIAIFELGNWLSGQGVAKVSGMNKGGMQRHADVAITMVNAFHSSSVSDGDRAVYAGEPAGWVLEIDGAPTLYHAGDTCVFSDMALIRDIYAPQVAMLPIGDFYTMGPRQAAWACKLLQPEAVIPMHYGTFPALTGTPAELKKQLKERNVDVEVLDIEPGATLS